MLWENAGPAPGWSQGVAAESLWRSPAGAVGWAGEPAREPLGPGPQAWQPLQVAPSMSLSLEECSAGLQVIFRLSCVPGRSCLGAHEEEEVGGGSSIFPESPILCI